MSMQRSTPIRGLAFVAVLALAAACGNDEPAVQPPVDPSPEGDMFGIATVDNNFAPSRLDVPAGEEITVEVQNNGQNPHSFTIDELDVDTGVLQAGETAEVTFAVPDEPVEFRCTVHPDMLGTVQPG
jgi:plastocyanin